MAELTRIIFRNMSPLHLGKGRDSYDVASPILPSDMLSSALASVRALEGRHTDLEEFLASFTISNAFPYHADEFFLPRPIGRLNISVQGQQEREYRKGLKKIQFISSAIWKELVSGKHITVHPAQIQGEFLIAEANPDYEKPMVHVANQRVMVPRDGLHDAVPFAFEWTFFRHGKKESGLYCLVQSEKDRTDEIIKLFKALGSLGIGADNTVGGGLFDIEVDETDIPSQEGNSTMLLSNYIPQEQEVHFLNLDTSLYSMTERGGYIAGSSNNRIKHLRRKTIYMFEAGSVFHTTQRLEGKIVNLAPQWNTGDMHAVYRSGKPLYVNVNL